MKMRFQLLITIFITLTASIAMAAKKSVDIDIPFEKFKLDNGLTVIVHEDPKAPIVAVNVWYKVGSKDEPKGKSGFAHLFEHLMFNGTENYNKEYFEPFYKVGATGINGTTFFDRTNYFQTVPKSALDMALWMESDRMGHLLGAIDKAKVDEQRGVVQNEKRQRENRPYGKSFQRTLEGLLPQGHPYRHGVIGSMEDLNAASLDDVKEWFKAYYGAANAVVVLAGDVKVAKAKELMQKYFGHIPSGPEVKSYKAMIPTRNQPTREVMYDKVPESLLSRTWAVSERTAKETTLLSLAASILGGGKNSRLYQELVYKNQLASSAEAYVFPLQLMSFFGIQVVVKKGVSEKKVEEVVKRVVADFLKKKPSGKELERVKTSIEASMIRGLELVGGRNGKAPTLAKGELYAGDPVFFKKQLKWVREAKAKDVLAVAQKWINNGDHQLWVLPFPKFKVAKPVVDRKKGLPAVTDMPSLNLPAVERGQLKNGINVVFMQNKSVPVVNVAVQFDAGYSADSTGFALGTSSFAMAMLDEGTEDRNALEISSDAELLGATISTSSNLDTSVVRLSALNSKLKDSMKLFAEIVKEPAFDKKEIERLKVQWMSKIAQEKSNPVPTALRNLPPVLYGKGHAYGIPFTGSGTEASIKSLTRDDLVRFYNSWIRPDNATIFVVGDTTLKDITKLLDKEFGKWKPAKMAIPTKNIAKIGERESQLIIIDKPDAPQSLILAGRLAPSTKAENNLQIEIMNEVFGGAFTARLNMNLREDKSWAYGAYSFMRGARGQRPYFVYAPVQTDKTGVSIKEIIKEMKWFTGKKPATQKELVNAVNSNVNKLPGSFESGSAMMSSLLNNHRFGRPDNYVSELVPKYRGLKLLEVKEVAKKLVTPKKMVWMIVGDRKKIEKQLKGLKLGQKVYMDTDGNIVE